MAKFEIHVSDVRSFKQCRRKWNWSSPLRQHLEPRVPYMPFFSGRAIHYAIEQFYAQDRTGEYIKIPSYYAEEWMHAEVEEMGKVTTLWDAEIDKLNEQAELIMGILENYYQWWKSKQIDIAPKWRDDQFEFISHETEFSVPLRTPETGRASTKVFLAGRFDGVVRRKDDGTLWLWEVKTTRSIKELSRSLMNDEQAGVYMLAAEEVFGEPVAGVIYNMMRKKVPTKPRQLKNGGFSKAKNIDTTVSVYWHTILEHYFPGGEIADKDQIDELRYEYDGIIEYLASEEYVSKHQFFARVPVGRTKNELTQLGRDTWTVALEMTRDNTPIYPTPNWMNCGFCLFRDPCLSYNAGNNYQFLLDTEYQKRRMWDPLTRKEESNE